jgi:sirohydrochlorin cobaltochelatase
MQTITPGIPAGIILAGYGSTHLSALCGYNSLRENISKRFPGNLIRLVFTSPHVLSQPLISDDIMTLRDAVASIHDAGCSRAVVQSLHFMPGSDFNSLLHETAALNNSGIRLISGLPLVNDADGIPPLVEALCRSLPVERTSDDAVLFMGHNSRDGAGNPIYAALGAELRRRDSLFFLANLLGEPDFKAAAADLIAHKVRRVYMQPLMIAAGGHLHHDFCGKNSDSWSSILETAGIECIPVWHGLGEYDEISQIFCSHITAALNN